VNVAGQSLTVVQAAGVALATPGMPALSPATVNGNQVTLAWTVPVGGQPATGFMIEASLTAGGPAIVTLPAGPAQTISATAPNGVYYVRVRGVNASGTGPASNEVVVVVGSGAVPSAPQNLAAIVTGNNLVLAWRAPSNAATAVVDAYVIEAGRAPGLRDLANLQTASPATLLTAVVPNGVYYVRVRARNGAGLGPPSQEVQVVAGVALPGIPVLSASVLSRTVTLSWSASGGGAPATGFVLQAGTSPGASNAAEVSLGALERGFTATAVPSGTYFVRVIAQGTHGNSLPSNEVIVVVP
jgi:hypothetical protein